MPDVGSQLAEYFEAATERIAADDVLVRAAVNRQAETLPRLTRLRPAWAAVIGFVGALMLVGGTLLAGWLLHDPTVVEPRPAGPPGTESGGGWGWWPLALVGGVAVFAAAVLVSRRLRRASKEIEMQSLDEKQQEVTGAPIPRRSRRGWFIGLAILVVTVGAIAAWAIIEANRTSDMDIAVEFADTGDIAWTTRDGEAWAAAFTEDGVYQVPIGIYEGRDRISTYVRNWGYFSELSHGEVTEVEDGVFSFPVRGVLDGATFEGELRITLEGDLVSHAVMVTWREVNE